MVVDEIEVANEKSLEEFIRDFMPTYDSWRTWTHPRTKESYSITIQPAKALSKADFDACFQLIGTTSGEDYRRSIQGWRPRAKRNEMKLLDLKYLLVKDDVNQVQAFMSLMPTYEDDEPVIYCYEIHLAPALQGAGGLGSLLMHRLEVVAMNVPTIRKVMLTCFLRNERALKFYEKLGYVKDESSPPDRCLRSGTRLVDFVILSKSIEP